jgi:hypothetical protein
MKLDSKYDGMIEKFVREGTFTNVFAGKFDATHYESSFVMDTLGAKENEMVVMKAGKADEGEDFFSAVSERVKRADLRQRQ